jgi:hypothetical protein
MLSNRFKSLQESNRKVESASRADIPAPWTKVTRKETSVRSSDTRSSSSVAPEILERDKRGVSFKPPTPVVKNRFAALENLEEEEKGQLEASDIFRHSRPIVKSTARQVRQGRPRRYDNNPNLSKVYIGSFEKPLDASENWRATVERIGLRSDSIASLTFMPGKRAEFIIKKDYKDEFLAKMKSLKFDALDNFDPLRFRKPDLPVPTRQRIIKREANRLAFAIAKSPYAVVREFFSEEAIARGPAFNQQVQEILEGLEQRDDSFKRRHDENGKVAYSAPRSVQTTNPNSRYSNSRRSTSKEKLLLKRKSYKDNIRIEFDPCADASEPGPSRTPTFEQTEPAFTITFVKDKIDEEVEITSVLRRIDEDTESRTSVQIADVDEVMLEDSDVEPFLEIRTQEQAPKVDSSADNGTSGVERL